MNQDQLNKIRAAAGLPPSYNAQERLYLEEKKSRKEIHNLMEAANHRPPPNKIAEIAREHLHVRSLAKSGDDSKDFHDCSVWAIENALKAAYKEGFAAGNASEKSVKESVADKESEEESKKGGSKPNFDPKGGEKTPKKGKDTVEKEDEPKEKIKEGIQVGDPEHLDYIKQALHGEEEEYSSAYKKGDLVNVDGTVKLVHVPDAKADYIGVIPTNLRNASEEEKQHAVDLVKISEVKPASDEDCEYSSEEVSVYGTGEKAGTMEGKEIFKQEIKNRDKGEVYNKIPHKSNSRNATSKDKSKKGLKKISEKSSVDATVWGKDYGRDDRMIDKDEYPDQLSTSDPNADIKISVPSEHKRSLQEAITSLKKEAEKVKVRDPYGSDFYERTAEVFEHLLTHLQEGTRRALMLAQIDLNRVMGPMQQRLPNDVYMYIVRGGKPAALTELFKEVKIKRETGADLSKEDYTK